MSGEPPSKKSTVSEDLRVFDELFPTLVNDLTKDGMGDEEIKFAMTWFKKVLEYNTPHGKKNRGLTVLHSYKFLAKDSAKEEDLKIARVIGWCIELLQAFFLVADDIMDHSVTRRGQPCWYKNEGVGLEAINDSFYLENAIYVLLKKYVKGNSYYVNILELFHETTLQTVIGQCLDMLTAEGGEADYSKFTIQHYKAIVKWKTAFYSFYMPVAAAMFMVGIDGEDVHKNAKTILLKMGEYFQIQDDFLDCYGAPEVIGKIGTDIQDRKCGWLAVQALNRCTPEQKEHFLANYGQHDATKINQIKKLYEDLGLKQLYEDYEEECYKDLMQLIEKLSGQLPKDMFVSYADKIFKRQK